MSALPSKTISLSLFLTGLLKFLHSKGRFLYMRPFRVSNTDTSNRPERLGLLQSGHLLSQCICETQDLWESRLIRKVSLSQRKDRAGRAARWDVGSKAGRDLNLGEAEVKCIEVKGQQRWAGQAWRGQQGCV